MARTLVVAQGLERDRILAAISVHSPQRLIIIRSKFDVSQDLTAEIERHIEVLMREMFPSDKRTRPYPFLSREGIDLNKQVDFFDLPSALSDILAIVASEKEKGYDVAIDISSGNKIVCIALFLAAQLHGLALTYSSVAKYSSMQNKRSTADQPTDPEQIAFAAQQSYSLPRLPLKLEEIPLKLLAKLASRKSVNSIKELIEPYKGAKTNTRKSDIVRYSRQVDVLADYGYVITKRNGRSKAIKITEEGEKVVSLVALSQARNMN